MAVVIQFITGFVGGIVGWLVTQFVAEPLTRFLRMRRDIAQHMLDYENVRARCNDRGDVTEPFTEQDEVRLRNAQKEMREFGAQVISFVQTDPVAAKLIWFFWRYDASKIGRSLVGLSHDLAVYGSERARHKNDIRDALRLSNER
jgi:hypothetical protein